MPPEIGYQQAARRRRPPRSPFSAPQMAPQQRLPISPLPAWNLATQLAQVPGSSVAPTSMNTLAQNALGAGQPPPPPYTMGPQEFSGGVPVGPGAYNAGSGGLGGRWGVDAATFSMDPSPPGLWPQQPTPFQTGTGGVPANPPPILPAMQPMGEMSTPLGRRDVLFGDALAGREGSAPGARTGRAAFGNPQNFADTIAATGSSRLPTESVIDEGVMQTPLSQNLAMDMFRQSIRDRNAPANLAAQIAEQGGPGYETEEAAQRALEGAEAEFAATPEGQRHAALMPILQQNTDVARRMAGKRKDLLTGEWTDKPFSPKELVSQLSGSQEGQRGLERLVQSSPEAAVFVQQQISAGIKAKEAAKKAAWDKGVADAAVFAANPANRPGGTAAPSASEFTEALRQPATEQLVPGGPTAAERRATHHATAKEMRNRTTIADPAIRREMVGQRARGMRPDPDRAAFDVAVRAGKTPSMGLWASQGLDPQTHPFAQRGRLEIEQYNMAVQSYTTQMEAWGIANEGLAPDKQSPMPVPPTPPNLSKIFGELGVDDTGGVAAPELKPTPVAKPKKPSKTSPAFRPQPTRVPAGAGIMPITRPGPGFTLPRAATLPGLGRMEGA